MYFDSVDISVLKNKIITSITGREIDELIFTTADGEKFKLYHSQNCCESVVLEDVCGDLNDLIQSPIIDAAEIGGEAPKTDEACKSQTWTFYRLSTIKGTVILRWYGSSNGYYSESVDFQRIA